MDVSDIPTKARAIIIGGGVSGCSVAYHLSNLGWKDIVLLERQQLTCGTTWHAAGLIGQLRPSQNLTRLAKYSTELYSQLENETGLATGFRQNGSITVALTSERREELYRQASMARAFGVDVTEITPSETRELYPHLNVSDVEGAVYLPFDGQCDPANIALALAKGARQNGALLVENVEVKDVLTRKGRVSGITWECDGEHGEITGAIVINCAGMWARELAALSGVTIPLHACEHFYMVTEAIPNLGKLPVLRVPDECAYYKEDAGKLLVGAFEPVAKPWGMEGIPDDFCFDQLPEDIDHLEPVLAQAVKRLPLLAKTGMHTFFNGPESFTPDNLYYIGEAPELSGYWVAAGYNSIGIVSSGGAGMALAHWIVDGEAPFDLWDVDIRRVHNFQKNRFYLRNRVSETLGLLYADHFPHRQPVTARGVRRSPLHSHLEARGACFGETAGWERANWIAPSGVVPEYRYSWGRQNWFEHSRGEHLAVRQGAGLFDMSSFGKLRVEGRDAETVLNKICANDVAVPSGRLVYTQWLNKQGGIQADLTVARLSETEFLIVTSAATVRRDLYWLRHHIPGESHVVVTDVTAAEAVLCLMGPNSREVLGACSPADLSGEAFPFGSLQEIEIGMGLARAHRVSYVGELGWELYVSADMACHVFECIEEAGVPHELKLCGLHMMDSCRIEKAFRHMGHDITSEDHVLEAGLGFAVRTRKPEFLGRDAVLRKREEGLSRRLMQFRLRDPEPLLFHNEPILRDGEIVGHVTSGNYGHSLGGAVGLGYVPCPDRESADVQMASSYQIEIAGSLVAADVSVRPMYDPVGDRMRV